MTTTTRPKLQVREAVFGGHSYLLCVPLVSATRERLVADARHALAYRPDLLEWRADYYEGYPRIEPILEGLAALRDVAGDTPIIFTTRHAEEDGARAITVEEKSALIDEASRTGMADLIDIELQYGVSRVASWRQLLHDRNVRVIVSAHSFKKSTKPEALIELLRSGQETGADIVKYVTRARNIRELADLSDTIHEARETFVKVPLIVGAVGSVSPLMRLIGDYLGSDMTFVSAGTSKSHASQLHIEEFRRLRDRLAVPPFGQR